MTELIMCLSEIAKTPYYVLGLGMNIYSCEELCFYLTENSSLLDRDIMDVKLCQWIERELGLKKLGKILYGLLEKEAELGEFVTAILKETHYCTADESDAIELVLHENANLGFAQKRKARADSLLNANKLALAIDEYHYILQGMHAEEDPTLYSSILHNVATAYAKLFLFDKAGQYYKEAYDTDQNEESYLQYLATLRLTKGQREFQNTIVLKGIDQEMVERLEQMMSAVETESPDTEYAKSLEQIRLLKQNGQVNEFYDKIEQTLNGWKADYRKKVMNI